MQTIKIGPKRTITLPYSVFKTADKVVVISTGDTVMIKKMSSPNLSSLASGKKGKAPSLREIAKEVHLHRY